MSENRCICCGAVIPEGLQVCPSCEQSPANGPYEAVITDRYNFGYRCVGPMAEVSKWAEAILQTGVSGEVKIRRVLK